MLRITIISILSFYYQLSDAITGPNGQECAITGDNACPMVGTAFTSLIDSEIECEDPYECCLCQSITCGSAMGERCEKFEAKDSHSVFNVYPITINGDFNDGAEVECSGTNSCHSAQMTGTFIKEFKCDELSSCAYGTFSLEFIEDGKVQCSGTSACEGAEITVYNVEKIECDGQSSCSNSIINVINPQKDFELACKETGACQGAKIVIHFTSASIVNELNGIKCENAYACSNLNLEIINESPLPIKIEDLDCENAYACPNAVFTVTETSGLIIFEDCECDTNACIGTIQGGTGTPIAGGKCFPFGTTTTTTTTIIPTQPTQPTATTTPAPTTTTTISAGNGPNGQDCTPGIDDNLPDACPIINGEFTGLIGTEIECEENFDCCMCKYIICGGTSTGSFCEKFKADGDSSAFYVYPIEIYGEYDEGAEIDCNGDSSCEGARFNGTNIKDIKCSGDRACVNTRWNVACMIDEGCKIECDGDLACQDSIFKVSYSNGLKCSDLACMNSKFKLSSNLGDKVECDSEYSCQNALIEINQIETLKCGDVYSCQNAEIIITNPKDGLEIECDGPWACENMNLTIIVPIGSTIEEIESIKCGEQFACLNANVTIINQRGIPLIIEELDCEAVGSCQNMQFNLIGNVLFEECKCGDSSGCLNIIGIDSCFTNLDKLECKDANVCANQNIEIINPSEDFELKCEEVMSCYGLNLTITINNLAEDFPIEEIKGVKCEKALSCAGLRYNIINEQGIALKVEKIECEDANSCQNARFSGNGVGNVIFEEIDCDEYNACGTMVADQCLAESYGTLVYCGSEIFN